MPSCFRAAQNKDGAPKIRLSKGFDFENAPETSVSLKYHCLYVSTDCNALKIRNCAVGAEEPPHTHSPPEDFRAKRSI